MAGMRWISSASTFAVSRTKLYDSAVMLRVEGGELLDEAPHLLRLRVGEGLGERRRAARG